MTDVVRAAELREAVLAEVAALLDGAFDASATFADLGIDSLMATRLRNRLVAATGVRLPVAVVFDHPTPAALSAHLAAQGAAVAAAETADPPMSDEPVAIVAMACRYPGGVRSPEDLWRLVIEGVDAVSEFPDNRGWNLTTLFDESGGAGTSQQRAAGFLSEADRFDAGFFGLTPREALAMDPQQRLVLECVWETFERAGVDPTSLRGSRTGVFVGAMAQEYGPRWMAAGESGGYAFTGNTASVLSGRVAYTFGFEGPAVTLDTACSSSLVAIHTARRALQTGDCELAVAGGVTVMSSAGMFTEFSRLGALSADGRCRAFAAAADGFGLGEGAGVVLLERLSDAVRAGHPVLAVLRGSAINQDGASNGLTAPSGPAQRRLIQQALRSGGVTAAEVDAVEAHGTGTTLGDPIEAEALLATYGRERERPLWLGSLKSNIGHAQAAAGVGGVIKMVLALRHELLPPTLHVNEPTPHVDWASGAIRLLTEPVAWPRQERPRLAGVSSFGVSGTNAHAIVAQAPVAKAATARARLPLLVSAKTEAALRDQAQQVRALLANRPDIDTAEVATALATTRTHFAHRAVITDTEDPRELLRVLADGDTDPRVLTGAAEENGRTVFVFPGQGAQWQQMGRRLAAASPVFASHLRACADALRPHIGCDVVEVLEREQADELARVELVQPILFAVMVSLARWWQAYGVQPDAVIGHSQGEIAAAHIAGALSLADAAFVSAVRAKALTSLSGTGTMGSVPLPHEQVRAALAGHPGVYVACVNSPLQTVVSGDRATVEELIGHWQDAGVHAKAIAVDYASHCPHVDGIRDELLSALAQVTPMPSTVAFHSSVYGKAIDTTELTAEYWWRNLREPVQLDATVRGLLASGHRTFIETSPHPVLTIAVEQIAETVPDIRVASLATMHRDRDTLADSYETLGHAYRAGRSIDWAAVHRDLSGALARTVFVFPGHGSQWVGMGRELYSTAPIFARCVRECADALGAHLDWDVLDMLRHGQIEDFERDEIVQPLMFAVMVALARMWQAHGVQPDAVAGHSIGEIVAAHIAGALTLADAAAVSAAMAKAMGSVDGTMGTVPLPEDQVRQRLADYPEVSVGCLNSPTQTVVSGPRSMVAELVARWRAEGVSARTVAINCAAHSPHLDVARDDLLAALAGVTPRPSAIPFYSSVVGERIDTTRLTAEYWWRNLRRPVRWAAAVRELVVDGHSRFIEIGAHPVLTVTVEQTAETVPGSRVGTVATAHRGRAGLDDFYAALSSADAVEIPAATVPHVELPTYPFQRQRFWLNEPSQRAQGHPLLPSHTAPAGRDEFIWGGTIEVDGQPWLRDHVVDETVLLPGTLFLAAATHAATAIGYAGVDELTLQASAVFDGPLELQVMVAAPDEGGRRALTVHTRSATKESGVGEAWRTNAIGQLSHQDTNTPDPAPEVWPPAGQPVAVEDIYDALADLGYAYGPAFQGIRGVWRAERTVYLSLALPEGVETRGYDVHPALLDAAIQVAALDAATSAGRICLPFNWSGVRVAATASTTLRARLTFARDDMVSVAVWDEQGRPVVTGDELTLRPLPAQPAARSAEVVRRNLFRVGWETLPTAPGTALRDIVVVGDPVGLAELADVTTVADLAALGDLIDAGAIRVPRTVLMSLVSAELPEKMSTATLPADTRAQLHTALRTIQQFLADQRFAQSQLMLLTSRAVGVVDEPLDLRRAPLWGLVRSAQSEHPDRFVLLDVDESSTGAALARAIDSGEPELAVRENQVLVPRLGRYQPTADRTPPFDRDTSVLITGGLGALGVLVAKHLARRHGVRRLILVGRGGPDSPHADRVVAELAELGATAEVHACDVADRNALARLLSEVGARGPLGAVVHAAGVLRDATVQRLTPELLDDVLRPKVTAAWNLHELTRDLPLRAFILFSSIAATLGNAGQANYAAANTFLDALAQHRRHLGLPAGSAAWGVWGVDDGMVAGLGEADLRRLARAGWLPLSPQDGLDLFDAAAAAELPAVVAARFDLAALRQRRALRPIFAGLVRRSARHRGGVGADNSAWVRRVLEHPADRRAAVVQRAVLAEAATVAGGELADPAVSFRDSGFGSLMAVELRNRLASVTGLRLSSTVVFDYPTPAGLSEHLLSLIGDAPVTATESAAAQENTPPSEDPIVIVAMACRYPGGVRSPEDLWRLVADGVDAVGEFPADRGWDLSTLFDDGIGSSSARQGGFVDGVDRFDAAFFGVSPREAAAMDPQQRLVLETAWEVLERADIVPETLRGTQTGVFIGAVASDYGPRLHEPTRESAGYLLTGTSGSVLSGRVAYSLGLEGPAITVDTACSSSLVALHLAAQALRSGECSLAMAGGVTIMSSPGLFAEFSRQQGLAADGRCRAFAADADGTGWGEGVGLLLVEKLSRAQRFGHPVLAVLRGSAINQDGASNGLTAPNGLSQQRVIAQALTSGGLRAADVDVVEAHGTGTRLGDPIEAQALQAAYGRDRDRPLWLGSLKSNIGHAQAAAGVGGVIKMVLALRHRLLPKTLHVGAPTPQVDWAAAPVRLLTEPVAWTGAERVRRAAVSSFGISGTNAHVLIEQAPHADVPRADGQRPSVPLPILLSAKTDSALRDQARRLRDLLGARPDIDMADVATTLATARTHFPHRVALTAADRAELVEQLAALSEHGAGEPPIRGNRRTAVTVMFAGQGTQRPGMGAELYAEFPAFAEAFDLACAAFDPHLDHRLADIVFAEKDSAAAKLLRDTAYAQPALFALEVALYSLGHAWGLRPDTVIGHSIGELVAAHVAGVLTLEDAATLVAARGKLMGAAPGSGAMVSVRAGMAVVQQALAEAADRADIAAVNGDRSIVISGAADVVADIAQRLGEQGFQTSTLDVSHAFHSALMDPVVGDFERVAAGLTYQPPQLRIISNVTGRVVGGAEPMDAGYWVRQLREPVLFGAGIRAAEAAGATGFVEIGPDGTLSGLATAALRDHDAVIVPLQRRDRPQARTLLAAIAHAHIAGIAIDWQQVVAGWHGRRIPLPTYPFQGSRYWLEPGSAPARGPRRHPILGAAVDVPDTDRIVWTGEVSLRDHPWLSAHVVGGRVILPGSVYVDLADHAATATCCHGVAELAIERPLPISPSETVPLRVVVHGDATKAIAIYAKSDADWVRHASGTLAAVATPPPDADAAWQPDSVPVSRDDIYRGLAAHGLAYGAELRAVAAMWRSGTDICAEVELPGLWPPDSYGLHPALLDAALHAIEAAEVIWSASAGVVRLPFVWTGYHRYARVTGKIRVRIARRGPDDYRLELRDHTNSIVATIDSLVLAPAAGLPGRPATAALREWACTPVAASADPGSPPRAVVITKSGGDAVARLGEALRAEIHADVTGLLSALGDNGRGLPDRIVVPYAVDGRAVTELLTDLREQVEQVLAAPELAHCRIIVLTRDALATGTGATRVVPAARAAWGLIRALRGEHGRLALVDEDGGAASAGALAAAVGSTEPELILRDGQSYRAELVDYSGAALEIPSDPYWRLDYAGVGSPDNIRPVVAPSSGRRLRPDEVRVAVHTVGLNFRDVLTTLGVVSPRAGTPADSVVQNVEGAGVVLAIGAEVDRLRVGDRVMGLFDVMSPVAVGDHRLLTRVPDGWSFAEAASVPIAFLTAYYGLHRLAALTAGERVLVHTATGAVGMAAIQVARHLGADVYATASPGKWETLRAWQIPDDHIASSRDGGFEDRFRANSPGHPAVDVVLNSLAGPLTDASLRLLAPGGRFLDMGKTDARDPREVAARYDGVTYAQFDIRDPGPDGVRAVLDELIDLFDAGVLTPIPTTVRHVTEAPQVFRHMAEARHIGKLVLRMRDWRADRAVLLTDGPGAPSIARHLIGAHGVRTLVLVGDADPDLVQELRAQGARIITRSGDLGSRSAVARLLAELDRDGIRLGGIVHTVGANGIETDSSTVGFDSAWQSKALAAAHLDELTKPLDLSAFVIATSSPGPAVHAAVNGYLDGLAQLRNTRSQPGVAITWEPSGEAIAEDLLVRLFDRAVARGTGALVASDTSVIAPPIAAPEVTVAEAKFVAAQSDSADGLLRLVRTAAAEVLGMRAPDAIEPGSQFRELGLDSLGAIELRDKVSQATGVPLPATLIFDFPTPQDLVDHLRSQPTGAEGTA
ncbi:SDR family NAD(P)-dependent oxidoreductase [Nocardia sp. NPDC051321]|uniref:SDR family NAD(P)-dependent oxidoreductase n=1 Tax=Nocardia sp. NPDC051321 TaxID=3364323 RepID=UPI00378A7BDC